MADPLSVQLLAFNFASRTLAYQRLARGLNRSVTGFSAFVRNYLEPCLSANVCTQFMDDIGCGVESPEQLPYLRQIFQCLRRSGLKLSPEKCVFGSEQVSFLGNVITTSDVESNHRNNYHTSDKYSNVSDAQDSNYPQKSVYLALNKLVFLEM